MECKESVDPDLRNPFYMCSQKSEIIHIRNSFHNFERMLRLKDEYQKIDVEKLLDDHFDKELVCKFYFYS